MPRKAVESSRADPSIADSHDDSRRIDVGLDCLVRQYAATIDIDLVANSNIVSENCHILKASPPSDDAVPADDAAFDPCVIFDLGTREQDASLQPDTIANYDVGTNGHIGSYFAVLADFG